MQVGLEHFLVLSAALFCLGLGGALTKRNIITILMCVEIMFNGVNIALVAFSRYVVPTLLTGQVFAIFVITVAAGEVALGLAILLALYRNRETVDAAHIDIMKG